MHDRGRALAASLILATAYGCGDEPGAGPAGRFGSGQSASGTARILGDVEYVAGNKSSNTFYGLVSNDLSGVTSVTDVTVAPPYSWRP